MNRTANARRLRREQTDEEKELWRPLRAGRFAGFKFRRQHPLGAFEKNRFIPPNPERLIQSASSPRPSPPSDGGEGVNPPVT